MKHWLYPANLKHYDVISAFTKEVNTAWPMNSKVEVGDYVYIYLGSPIKQILFKCEVLKTNVEVEEIMYQAEKYAKTAGKAPNKKFMLLKTVLQFKQQPESLLSFTALKENGLKGSIMGPQCLENNAELLKHIIKVESL